MASCPCESEFPSQMPTYQISGGSYETSPGGRYPHPPLPYPQPQQIGYPQPPQQPFLPPPPPYPSSPLTNGYASSAAAATSGVPSPIQPDASVIGTYVDSMYDNVPKSGETASSEAASGSEERMPDVAYRGDEVPQSAESSQPQQTEVGATASPNGYNWHKAKARAAKTVQIDPKCNSSVLRNIMDMGQRTGVEVFAYVIWRYGDWDKAA
ncbi:hypothetical protein L596_027748 [Steinernema carpocapsae]|uniref:Uncharacterized protein n=1 Tax=Steinernema carpocapsae TaxID=34508 RepID=A0A4U5LWH0_STECR|nr:hypothetical protein L596_027748 [Steinernema carpocapsae]